MYVKNVQSAMVHLMIMLQKYAYHEHVLNNIKILDLLTVWDTFKHGVCTQMDYTQNTVYSKFNPLSLRGMLDDFRCHVQIITLSRLPK
jgi:hypothetical protein